MRHPSRRLEDSSAERNVDCGGPIQEISAGKNIGDHLFVLYDILTRMWLLSALFQKKKIYCLSVLQLPS